MLATVYDIVPDVHRIAILRANGIGDFIFSLPALEALRRAYPQAQIVLLAQEWHRNFLEGRPSPVDRVIVIPPARGVGMPEDFEEDPALLERFFQRMQQEHFDLAIQMHGGGRHSNPFVLRLGAKMTAGMKSKDAVPLDRWLAYVYFQHEVLRCLEVVSLVGAEPAVLEPRVAVTPADLAEARACVPNAGTPLVAIHAGAGDPRRRWPARNFAVLADELAARGACVVVVGSRQDEQAVVQEVLDNMRQQAHNLWGRLSLGGLAGLFSMCRLVVSNDSGPMHLASAVGTPTVGIYWCFNLINSAPLTRSRHRPLSSFRLDCPVCGANTLHSPCKHDASFVADVPVEQVLAAALDLLDAPPAGHTARIPDAFAAMAGQTLPLTAAGG